MSAPFMALMTSYLFMPILAMIIGFASYFLAKKNKLLSNKKLIFYILLVAVLLCLPALLGFIPYAFMPYIYVALQAVYLILGHYNVIFLRRYLQRMKKSSSFWPVFIIQFIMMFIGIALFSTVFNLCSEMKYGIWASTCLLSFLFPPLFRETCDRYMSIPLEVFKVWKYAEVDLSRFELTDYDRLLVVEIELYKIPEDHAPMKIKAKMPENMPFGVWFYRFLSDYNHKFPVEPVECNDIENPYSWIFYVKRSFFVPRKYIDCDLSATENRIREKYTIVARRVSEKQYTVN
jgi:hypothetical protein